MSTSTRPAPTESRGSPTVKAGYLQSTVAALSALPPSQVERIRACAAEALRLIESARRTAWLPFACDVELNLAVHDVAGAAGLTALNRRALHNAFRGPLLHTVVEGSKRLFGLSPAAMFTVAQRAWGGVTRDAGSVRAENLGSRHYALFHEDMPALYAGNEIYLIGFGAIVEGVLDFFECEGEVRLERVSPDAIRIDVRWR